MPSKPDLAYLRVSTSDQADGGAGLAAQRAAILAEAERRGWSEARFIEDAGYSGKSTNRPGLRVALEVLKAGRARGLIVAKMDRLSRSLLDFTLIMSQAQRQGWALLALDCPVDPTTPAGEAMASIMATFSQLERRLIGERTREALAVRRAGGARLGRRPCSRLSWWRGSGPCARAGRRCGRSPIRCPRRPSRWLREVRGGIPRRCAPSLHPRRGGGRATAGSSTLVSGMNLFPPLPAGAGTACPPGRPAAVRSLSDPGCRLPLQPRSRFVVQRRPFRLTRV